MRRRPGALVPAVVLAAVGSCLLAPKETGLRFPQLEPKRVDRSPVAEVAEVDLEQVASPSTLHSIYSAKDCEGVAEYFRSHPLPVGLRDSANGRLIAGWRVVCA